MEGLSPLFFYPFMLRSAKVIYISYKVISYYIKDNNLDSADVLNIHSYRWDCSDMFLTVLLLVLPGYSRHGGHFVQG